jgi:hypothetical protein
LQRQAGEPQLAQIQGVGLGAVRNLDAPGGFEPVFPGWGGVTPFKKIACRRSESIGD